MKISKQAYADMYGPTVGDKVRLADTELFVDRSHAPRGNAAMDAPRPLLKS